MVKAVHRDIKPENMLVSVAPALQQSESVSGFKSRSLLRGHSVGEKSSDQGEEQDYILKVCDFGQSRKLD